MTNQADIVSVYAYSPQQGAVGVEPALRLQHWELFKPIPGDEATPQTRISKIVDLGDQIDVYVLPTEGSGLSQNRIGLLFSMPRERVVLVTRTAPTATLMDMMVHADEDEDEQDEPEEAHPVPQAPKSSMLPHLPDPARYAVVPHAGPPSNT